MPSAWFPILARVRIGLLGGTFDPPHLAHLHTGEVAYRQLDLDKILFIPAGSPWQKAGQRQSAAVHRWEMTRRAVADVAYFEADDREVHRDGWTYTADTLASFDPDIEVTLILGADAAQNLPTWERADEVMAAVTVAVAPRPGIDRGSVEAALGHRPVWLEMAPLEMSGTMIRGRESAALPTRFLVRDAVWRYYRERYLYVDESAVPVA